MRGENRLALMAISAVEMLTFFEIDASTSKGPRGRRPSHFLFAQLRLKANTQPASSERPRAPQFDLKMRQYSVVGKRSEFRTPFHLSPGRLAWAR